MTAPALAHRVMRESVEEHTGTHLTASGGERPFSFTTFVRVCACGRVFRSNSHAVMLARYVTHIPRPKAEADQ